MQFLTDGTSKCACCGRLNASLLSLAAVGPSFLGPVTEYSENSSLLLDDDDILTEDFCRHGPHRFVRSTIEFPIQGSDEVFLFGCWGSLSQTNFDRYVELFDERRTYEMGSADSWLCNAIPATEDKHALCRMEFQEHAQRPKLFITDEEHPLFTIQKLGLDVDTLLDWLESYGHRPFERNRLH
ncbi:DUF2199 domain-containing protein [Aliiroseovarius crassostreae]|uniref:DUF2199 domain-containing protein n=1 Tax=Aliiroseovarius crassostreae TaxID=154981 RepID=UPI0022037114|nr:DUF2199 domain-containing protein [Aliiroseovarius crassostreae]UWP99499.1 DUF2199 domain-containing protein [Aliiroseovarius crassostreae]